MKVVTLRGTWVVDLQSMKVRDTAGGTHQLRKVPSPVLGERCEIETDDGVVTTEQVTEVTQ